MTIGSELVPKDLTELAVVSIKALLLYLTAVFAFRVSKPRTLAEMSPFDFVAAVGAAEMAEEQVAVFGKEARDLGELRLIDIFVVAEAQVANRFKVGKLPDLGFKRADTGFQVGGHVNLLLCNSFA